jgi:gluconolactonase
MMTPPAPSSTLPVGWRLLAEGAGFVEGPVAQGGHVDFVSINRGAVYRARLDGGGVEVRTEPGGGPNGATADACGRLWIVQNGARVMESRSARVAEPGIQVVEADGTTVSAVARTDLHAPNDCAFGPDDRLWFTDPYGRLMPAPPGDPDRTGCHGRVWACDPSTGDLELIAEKLPHPNGLCFSPDGELLYVSDTRDATIVVVDVAGDGVRRPREVATLPEGKPDGMAFDSAGNLWVAATSADGLGVLSPAGRWEYVGLGESFPTNLCFAGPELTTLVVTAARGGRVLARENSVPGLALHAPAVGRSAWSV